MYEEETRAVLASLEADRRRRMAAASGIPYGKDRSMSDLERALNARGLHFASDENKAEPQPTESRS
jgi:hypothetical protein